MRALFSVAQIRLPVQLVQHGLHFAHRVAVAAALGAGNAALQPGDCLRDAASRGQRLRGHKVARGVLWIVGRKRIEFRERGIGLAGTGQLHRQPVAGKAVLGVEFQNLFEAGDLFHNVPVNHILFEF